MRTLEEARNTLQISQEDIDFIIEGILRAGEPIVIIAYGFRLAAKPMNIATTTFSVFPPLRDVSLRNTRLQPMGSYGDSLATWTFSS